MADYSKMSDAELLAKIGQPQPNDYSKMSDAELMSVVSGGQSSAYKDSLAELSRLSNFEPNISTGGALAIGAAKGLSANFHDEIVGASKASGLPEFLGGLRAPIGLARMGYEKMTGDFDGKAQRAYEDGRDAVRKYQKAAQAQQPVASTVGEIGGALATAPLLPAAGGATMLARMGNAAKAGMAYGAVAGAGEGEGALDTAKKAAIGAGVGGIAGGLAVPAIEGAAALGGKALGVFKGATQAGQEKIAANMYVDALEKAGVNPEAVPAFMQSAQAAGIPVRAGDVGQGATGRIARWAGNVSDEAGAKLDNEMVGRVNQQADWFRDMLSSGLGRVPDKGAAREALEAAYKSSRKPFYEAAYQAGDRPVWSTDLERLVGAPEVVDAMKSAAKNAKSWEVANGYGGLNTKFKVTDDGRLIDAGVNGGVPTYPNLQFWDLTRRELSSSANKAARSGDDATASRLGSIAKQMNAELDKIVPEYGVARGSASGFLKMLDAEGPLEAGKKLVMQRMDTRDLARLWQQSSPQERALIREGYASELFNKFGDVRGNANLTTQAFLNAPNAINNMKIVLGDRGVRSMEASIRIADMMRSFEVSAFGNSTTARQASDILQKSGIGPNLAAGGIASGLYAGVEAARGEVPDWKVLAGAGIAGAMIRGRSRIDQKIATKFADLVTSQSPESVQKAIDIATREPRMLDALRRAHAVISREAASHQPAVPIFQAPGRGVADNEQPEVKRPLN